MKHLLPFIAVALISLPNGGSSGWFANRDNTFLPIELTSDTWEAKIGRSMAVAVTRNGVSNGIQVCPGVFAFTAHGILDNPHDAGEENRPARTPSDQWVDIFHYPFSENTAMTASNNDQFWSPRIDDPKTWTEASTDFVFVKVDTLLDEDSYVRPVESEPERTVRLSKDTSLYHFRGRTLFDLNEHGLPDSNLELVSQSFPRLMSVYDKPFRVAGRCQVIAADKGLVGSNCPAEYFVSGTPLIGLKELASEAEKCSARTGLF